MSDTKDLAVVVNEQGLEKPKAELLLSSFAPFFAEAKELVKEGRSLEVTDVNDDEGMKKAREIRRKLQDIRTKGVEVTRKELKEQSLRESRAIDGMANVIKAIIVPVEKHLMEQEKYKELQEEKLLLERYQKRIDLLSQYVDDVTLYKIKEMSDEAFEKLLGDAKLAHEAKVEAERKAEEERLEQERKLKLLNDRKLEIAPYRDYITDTMPKLTIETTEDEFKSMLKELKELKKKDDEERKALAEKAKQERIAREEAEEKLRKQQEAEKQRKIKEEAEAKAKAEAEAKAKAEADEKERQAMLAPDKDKLTKFANELHDFVGKNSPALKSDDSQQLLNRVLGMLNQAEDTIRKGVKKL